MNDLTLPNIGFFEIKPGFGGGNAYQKKVASALAKKFNVQIFKVTPKILPKARRPRMLLNIFHKNKKEASIDLWVRDFLGVAGMRFLRDGVRNIALFFHVDYDHIPNKWMSQILDKYFWKNITKCDQIVVISKYWKDYFKNRGINNVKIIYMGLDAKEFTFNDRDVIEFKTKYSLTGKPIIYLGNCQERKGVKEAYSYLRNLPFHLVTSGKKEIDIPVKNLELEYREYLMLLKSASVALTMSLFKEGWNITAHEAMMCRTPVIGSGTGGMSELLKGGNQIICDDFSSLPEMVEYAIKNRENLGEKGFHFAEKFSIEQFENEWQDIAEDTLKNVL
jgi:glycosyltransferase involved in cell wall biosynthesis